MSVVIREMTTGDYDGALAQWQAAPGVAVTSADTREGVAAFLERNPSLSSVALDGNAVVGTVLCGHDGRRGYLSHLAVADNHRRSGVGRKLVQRSIELLDESGIEKCHLLVFRENELALSFWKGAGWVPRVELELFSTFTAPKRRDP
jgi:ribosomal protein S18 acetylase RimI-like enzyme